jgi:rare lipoprotein A
MNSKFTLYFRLFIVMFSTLHLSFCSRHAPSRDGRSSHSFDGKTEQGFASWYGDQFHGKKTASGETYNMYTMTAAHRYAPFGTQIRVTNLENNRQTVVKINDRGPFVRGRIIDLSKKAAEEIGMIGAGTARVRLEFLHQTPINNGDIYVQTASFGSENKAKDYLQTLQKSLPDLSVRIYKENNYFRIRSGPYDSIPQAEADVLRLKRANFEGLILHTR